MRSQLWSDFVGTAHLSSAPAPVKQICHLDARVRPRSSDGVMERSRERGYGDTPSYQTHQRLDTIVSLKNGPIWERSVGSVNVAEQAFLTLASADVTVWRQSPPLHYRYAA